MTINFNKNYGAYSNACCAVSLSPFQPIPHPLRHPKFYGDQKLFPENMTDNTKKLFINELMNKSPERKSGLEYMYGEADPNATVYTFTNLLNFNLYYVTIRACYETILTLITAILHSS